MNSIKTPTQLRLTQDLLERADALIEVMAADPEVRALGMPTRTRCCAWPLPAACETWNASTSGRRRPTHRRPVPPPRPMTRPLARAGDALPRVCARTKRIVRRMGRSQPNIVIGVQAPVTHAAIVATMEPELGHPPRLIRTPDV